MKPHIYLRGGRWHVRGMVHAWADSIELAWRTYIRLMRLEAADYQTESREIHALVSPYRT